MSEPTEPKPSRRVIATPRVAGVPPSPSTDAQSIYGTRATTRRRQAQRRRLMHNLMGLLFVLLLMIGAWLWLRMPRAPQLALQWQRQLPATIAAAPVVVQNNADQWLLLPTLQGRLLKFDTAKADFTALEAGNFALRGAPLIEQNRVYIGGEDGVVRALDWTNGRQFWQAKTNASISARPAIIAKNSSGVVEDLVVVGDDDGIVMALRARDGKMLWRQRLDGPVGDGLATVNGARSLILVPVLSGALARGGLRALDARNGREVWRYPTDKTVFAAQIASPLVAQIAGKTRVFCVDDAGVVTALNAQTGGRSAMPNSYEWKVFVPPLPKTPADRAISFRIAPRLLSGSGLETLIIGGNDGGVRALDARNGRVRWSFAMDAPIADIAVAGSDVFALDDGGVGWRLQGVTGSPLARWQIDTTRATYRGLVVAPQSGQLFAIARGQISSFAVADGAAR